MISNFDVQYTVCRLTQGQGNNLELTVGVSNAQFNTSDSHNYGPKKKSEVEALSRMSAGLHVCCSEYWSW